MPFQLETFGPRIGYFPLLVSTIRAHFSSSLPPGVDTVWFEYKGLPLKWYIPIGVLFDLLCADPERPWNLTAAFIITGNSKNVMNMSQADQLADPEPAATTPDSAPNDSDTTPGTPCDREPASASPQEMDVAKKARVKLVRIEGMELGMDTPFLWVANNLKNPECFLHVCVYIGA